MRKKTTIPIIILLIIIILVVITYLKLSITHRTYTRVNRLGYYLEKMNIMFNRSIGLEMSKLTASFYAETRLDVPMLTYARAIMRNITYIREILNKNITITYVNVRDLRYRLTIVRGKGNNTMNDTEVIKCKDLLIIDTRYDDKISKVCMRGLVTFYEYRNGRVLINRTIRVGQCMILHISSKLPENEESRKVVMTILTARALAEIYLPEIFKNLKPVREEHVNNQKCIEYTFTGTVNMSKAIISREILNYIMKITHLNKKETSRYLTEIAKILIRNRQDIAIIRYRTCILENGIPITQSITIQNKENTIKITTNYTITNIETIKNITTPKIEEPTKP
ncbi:MAG: hypothetical protein GXO10_01825, partial [Crenarchaeota archaeon]|nr:hypothetical protein [Thermoproteota archaeon]